MVRKIRALGLTIAAAAAVNCAAPDVLAQAQETAQRTIIERLDDAVDKKVQRSANADKRYDFSVLREALPPLDADILVDGAGGWAAVVDAQELQTGSLQSASSGPPLQWWIVFAVLTLGTAIFIVRHVYPKHQGARLSMRFAAADADANQWSALLSPLQSTMQFFRSRLHTPQGPPPQWDQETENASAQMTSLLAQIDSVVARLKDGSPLRDVLKQELRLIHYRIAAASEAARSGRDSSEKSAARFRGLVRELERVRRIADSAAVSVIDPTEQLGLPQTTSEAYALLGVNADVAPPVLKKLVDALRMTWHPDHARNESDRILREERIKQINSAWDLIHSGPGSHHSGLNV